MKNIEAYAAKTHSSARAKAAVRCPGGRDPLNAAGKIVQWAAVFDCRADSGDKANRQAVTKHLRVLERVASCMGMREGRESLFTFNPQSVIEMKEYLEMVSKQWMGPLARLKTFIESGSEGATWQTSLAQIFSFKRKTQRNGSVLFTSSKLGFG